MTKPRVQVNGEDVTDSITDDQIEALKKVMEAMKPQPMMVKAIELGETLYEAYKEEESDGKECGKLLLQWTKEVFWGRMVADNLKHFDSCYEKLEAGGHIGQENRFVYGDLDVGLWIEPAKKEYRKVIVAESYCTCADDNKTIYIKDGLTVWAHFRIVTAYPDEMAKEFKEEWKKKYDWSPKAYDEPSLADHRDANWDYGYQDARDNFHVLSWTNSHDEKGRVDMAHATENKIYWALWNLRMHDQEAGGENMI